MSRNVEGSVYLRTLVLIPDFNFVVFLVFGNTFLHIKKVICIFGKSIFS